MPDQLYIPKKIKVGFNARSDTYSGRLAYVIYFDHKGKLRKSTSWENWRQKDMEPEEYDNAPMSGFVLNKKVGGVAGSYSWNTRNEYVRVYDPRNFEFEILIPNLLFILRECDCSKGKGLEGEFVYAWDGKQLVLLPAISEDYQKSLDYTRLQGSKVKAKELVNGATYVDRRQRKLTYIGKLPFHRVNERPEERYVFHDGDSFEYLKNVSSIAELVNGEMHPDYAELAQRYHESAHGTAPIRLYLKATTDPNTESWRRWPWFIQDQNGTDFTAYDTNFEYGTNKADFIVKQGKYSLADGIIVLEIARDWYAYKHDGARRRRSYYSAHDTSTYGKWIEPTEDRLYAELASGKHYRVSGNQLYSNNEED